jgi:hypothetical protein
VAMAATENGLEMNVEIAPDVPTTIGGDANRLRQILTNLLANALKFTEVGEVDLRVQLRDGALVLSVRDTGIGIPPEACDRIFEPFTQADRTVTQRFGGTGLGLAISKRLATGMGGDIAVESILGVGTTFTVTLPLRAPLGPPHGARFRELQGLSVLLAHGRPARRGQLRGLLEAYGCRLRCVATAAEAEREVRDAARGDPPARRGRPQGARDHPHLPAETPRPGRPRRLLRRHAAARSRPPAAHAPRGPRQPRRHRLLRPWPAPRAACYPPGRIGRGHSGRGGWRCSIISCSRTSTAAA